MHRSSEPARPLTTRTREDRCLVLASNPSGGIARHLSLATRDLAVEVHPLSETPGLTRKLQATSALLAEQAPERVVTHGVAAAACVRLRPRSQRQSEHVEFWHGDPFFDDARKRRAWLTARRLGRRPDLQVFVSQWLADAYADPGVETAILPIAVPDLELDDRRSADLSRSALYLGRFSHEKGVDELLGAWPAVRARSGTEWSLLVHSDGGLHEVAGHDGITHGGELADDLEVHAALQAAALVVIPSRTETGPYVALEAMRAGRPFVGTEVGEMPGLVEDSGCGWVVPPRDPAALAEALATAIAAGPEERAQRGAAGRDWLLHHRRFDDWTQQVHSLYLGAPERSLR